MTIKRYAHFVDFKNGDGKVRDYVDLARVLKRHSVAVHDPLVERSYILDYGDDPDGTRGQASEILADWRA